MDWQGITNLVETDVGGLLTEALTADVHLIEPVLAIFLPSTQRTSSAAIRLQGGRTYAVLADQTSAVGADTADSIEQY